MQNILKIIRNILKSCKYIQFNFWDFMIAGAVIFLSFILFNFLYNPNFKYIPNIKEMKINNVNRVCIDNFCREFKNPTNVYFYFKKTKNGSIIQIKREKSE